MASTPTTGRSSIRFASPVTEKNPVNKCEMKAWIRVDGKRPGSPYKLYWAAAGSYRDVMKRLARK